jgi:hypothetical protein
MMIVLRFITYVGGRLGTCARATAAASARVAKHFIPQREESKRKLKATQ